MFLPENATKDKQQELKSILELITQKLSSYDKSINLDINDPKSFLNTYLKDFNVTCAELQKHYSPNIKESSYLDYLYYHKNVKQMFDNIKNQTVKGKRGI